MRNAKPCVCVWLLPVILSLDEESQASSLVTVSPENHHYARDDEEEQVPLTLCGTDPRLAVYKHGVNPMPCQIKRTFCLFKGRFHKKTGMTTCAFLTAAEDVGL